MVETHLTSAPQQSPTDQGQICKQTCQFTAGLSTGEGNPEAEIEVLTNRAGSTRLRPCPWLERGVCICVYVCVSAHICAHVYLGISRLVCLRICVCVFIWMCICMFVTLCVCVRYRRCVCVYICVSHCLCMDVSVPGVPAVQGGTPVWPLKPTQGRRQATDPTGRCAAHPTVGTVGEIHWPQLN